MTDEGESDFLKEERENDPARIQKEYLELAKEALGNLKRESEERKKRLSETQADFCTLEAPPRLHSYRPPRPTFPITIQQIENGFLVHHGQAHNPTTEYAPDPEQVRGIVSRELGAFLAGLQGGVLQACGCPPPKAGKALPEGSLGMERREGPPPVSGPLEGPLEP